jgi:hypothetical protein
MGDDFGDRADFEIPIAAFEGLELPHFIRDLDPVSEILIFHYSLLIDLEKVSEGVEKPMPMTLAKFTVLIKPMRFSLVVHFEQYPSRSLS